MDNVKDFYSLYDEWEKTATEQEIKLSEVVFNYEKEYFDDMTLFEPNSIIANFMLYQDQDKEGKLFDTCVGIPLELESLFCNSYRFYVRDIDTPDRLGEINTQERTITISPESVDDKVVILHEMIHAYINILNDLPMFYRDILFMCLFSYLKTIVPNFDDCIIRHSHLYEAKSLMKEGGVHDMLFLFKSLDLDLRCGYKLGTVFGYGRDE